MMTLLNQENAILGQESMWSESSVPVSQVLKASVAWSEEGLKRLAILSKHVEVEVLVLLQRL